MKRQDYPYAVYEKIVTRKISKIWQHLLLQCSVYCAAVQILRGIIKKITRLSHKIHLRLKTIKRRVHRPENETAITSTSSKLKFHCSCENLQMILKEKKFLLSFG